jgi:hypothetical protein
MNQPALMEEHLTVFRHEIEDFSKNEYDTVDQAALLWKIIHYMVIKYQEMQVEWAFVRYEDLALEPIEGFRKIFQWVKLPFSEHTRGVIRAHSLQEKPSITTDPYAIKQDPFEVISKWKKFLTPSEVNRIRERVEEVSSAFYSDEDWELQPS